MSRWSRYTDELAAALTGLLEETVLGIVPIEDLEGTLACRDRVVGQLRALVGSVAGVPVASAVAPLTAFDITQRPAQALHQALAGLPAAVPATARPGLSDTAGLTDYEQLWRDAARACEGLQDFVEVLGELPGERGWLVLRDLADFSATLPAVDRALSEAVLPPLKGGAPLALTYALLTRSVHDEVRLCSAEIQTRVAAARPSRTPPAELPTVIVDQELGQIVQQCARQVRDRRADLSIAELRAVTRLLQFGSTDAATVLERSEQVLPGAGQAARAAGRRAARAGPSREPGALARPGAAAVAAGQFGAAATDADAGPDRAAAR